MRYLVAAHTDAGINKKINQDAFCLKIARTPKGHIVFAVICDGMGGLNNGELASSLVVNAFSEWFESSLPSEIQNGVDLQHISDCWYEIACEQNRKIAGYGEANGFSLGTTLTGMLIIEDRYLFIQVGDSRIYRLRDAISQMTRDQTLVTMELEKNMITPEQARADSRNNILLQCIGASKFISPDLEIGEVDTEDVFLLCSDGFRNKVSDDEFFGILAPSILNSEPIMKKCLVGLVELNKTRKERDNITALLIKAVAS